MSMLEKNIRVGVFADPKKGKAGAMLDAAVPRREYWRHLCNT